MAIAINTKKCDKCGDCIWVCPFDAIKKEGGYPVVNSACRACGACIDACGRGAVVRIDDKRREVDKNAWSGILVFAEAAGGRLHPVVRELTGKALELAGGINHELADRISQELACEISSELAGRISHKLANGIGHEVNAVIIAEDTLGAAAELLSYGVDKVFTYEHEAFRHFRADIFANAFSDAIKHCRPAIVLTGATPVGRSLAPRVSARFRTGLTADCTGLEVTDETDLVQVRPAFGGNIMAKIITPRSRPQFATVRYKVMDKAPLMQPRGEIVDMPVYDRIIKSGIEMVSVEAKPPSENISEAEILVVAGKGLRAKADLEMIEALAAKLGGQYAVTRPLVEAGWAPQSRQIGLSGRTVKPRLLISFGVSGAVQFTAAMKGSECIFAVNNDPRAPIMDIAHYGVVGDLYEILPKILEM